MTTNIPHTATTTAVSLPVEIEEATVAAPVARTRFDRPLQLRVLRPTSSILVVRATGALDLAATPRLAELLTQRLRGTSPTLVLDCAAVDFANTAAIHVLLGAATHAASRDKRLALVSSSAVQRVLTLSGLTDRFTYATRAEAALTASTAGSGAETTRAVQGAA